MYQAICYKVTDNFEVDESGTCDSFEEVAKWVYEGMDDDRAAGNHDLYEYKIFETKEIPFRVGVIRGV